MAKERIPEGVSGEGRILDGVEARVLLYEKCQNAGSQKAYAQSVGISQAFVSKMLSGKIPLSKRTAEALGLKRKIFYTLDKGE